jgi:hypothetical protein
LVVGWAPYRFGHWIWVGPWGWTWVEDEPWGFAPFHYGRWAFAGSGWFWVPGPVYVRPVWAPALVAWVGGAPGFRFSVGVGVGWFPLGPGEVFIPGYRVSRGYVNNVNLTNTTVNISRVTNVYNTVVIDRRVNNITYVNRNVNGGVTVVSHETFVNARPVGRNVLSVPARELASAPVSHTVAAEPARGSVLGAGRVVARKPPAAVTSRPVVALRTPAPMPRSFDQKQAQAGGHLNQSSSGQSLVRQEAPGRPVPANQGRKQPQTQTEDGFRPFGQTSGGNSNVAKPQPRAYEQQGPSEPERNTQPQPGNRNSQTENRPAQPSSGFHPPQENERPAAPEWSHPLAKPVPPVQERNEQRQERNEQQKEQKFNNWQQQRPAPAPRQEQHSAPPPRQEKPSKK